MNTHNIMVFRRALARVWTGLAGRVRAGLQRWLAWLQPPPEVVVLSPFEAPQLEAMQLSKSFGGRTVVHEVSFKVGLGEAVGLLGPNGAGKTTSFYMIAGLVRPDKGRIFLNNMDVTALPLFRRARRGLGYLPQESSIFRGLTVDDNIMAILEAVEADEHVRLQQQQALLEQFAIAHLRDQKATSLSGGERRRLEIAQALASRPQFILLDEPLAGIDPIAVQDIRALIKTLKQHNIGVLITDHNVRETLHIVDRAYILFEGRIIKQGSSDEITQDSQVQQVYLGDGFQAQ